METRDIDSGRLRIRRERGPAGSLFVLEGQVDERCDLAKLAEEADEGRPVVFDLAEVSFINSIGVREWIRMLHAFARRSIPVTLRNCSEAMVQQMNMIIEAQTGARVESFFAPYECDSCGREASMALDVEEHREALRAQRAPALPCPDCGGQMQFSELPDRYLLFLEHGSSTVAA